MPGLVDTPDAIVKIQKVMNESGLEVVLILNKAPGAIIQGQDTKSLQVEIRGDDTFFLGYKRNSENGKLTLMSLSRIKGEENADAMKIIKQYQDIALEIVDNLISDYLVVSHMSYEKFASKGAIHFITNKRAFDALDNLAEAS